MHISSKLLLAAALVAATPALAQNPPPESANAPPARVGRVAFAQGNVAIYQLGQSDWSKAAVNLPVAAGDWFATDKEARAELRIGSDSLDLAGGTELNLADLREQTLQVALSKGRIDLHLRELAKGETDEVDIPLGGVWMLEPGIYDVAIGAGGQPTKIAVFEGKAHFVGGSLDKTISTGETLVLSGSGASLVASIEKAAPDQFAEWCRSRDYQKAKLASSYYVSPRMTGYEELDSYGRWETVREYGRVWYPASVPVGWIPYRDGYWDWDAPWGWTWVSYEPWGFAPFHYGRWAYIDGLWGWVPGAYVAEPVYAPALVGWIGDPAVVLATGFGGAAVGWFPLGPGDPYYPSYTTDIGYIRAVNRGAVANAASLTAAPATLAAAQGRFANRRFATVVPQQVLTSGAPVRNAALPVSDRAVQRASLATRPNAPHPSAAAQTGAHRPGAPNFARLAGPAGRTEAAAREASPHGPPGAPNFAHLAPTPGAGHGGGMTQAAGRAARAERAGAAGRAAAQTRAAEPRAAAREAARARAGERHFAGPRAVARAHAAGRHFAGPRAVARAHAGPHFGGPRAVARAHAGPHFAGRAAAPHFAGPRMAGPRRAAPHFAGAPRGGFGGGPHFAGPPHRAGGGPHGGGGGPHGGGGGPHGGSGHGKH